MDWFRWHHGTVTDPKWRVVSRRASVTVRDTLAVWAAMLECASQADDRGTLSGWDHEDVAAALDMEPEQVEAIYGAMQGKVLEGDCIRSWEKRQPKREDSTASDRKRAQRDRARMERDAAGQDDASRTVTQCHAPDKIREDKRREEKSSEAKASGASAPSSDPEWLYGDGLTWMSGKSVEDGKARAMIGRWRKLHGDAPTRRAIEAAMREDPMEPIAWVTAALQDRQRARDGPVAVRVAI